MATPSQFSLLDEQPAPAAPKRTWLPFEWLDEIIPATRPAPSAFLAHRDGAWWIEDGDGDREQWSRTATIGEAVDFVWTACCGTIRCWIWRDETGHLDFERMSESESAVEPNVFSGPSNEIAHDLEEAIRLELDDRLGDLSTDPAEGEEMTIDAWYWSEPVPFRLECADDRTARFVPIDRETKP